MAKVCRYMYCSDEEQLTIHCVPEEELDSNAKQWECECSHTISESEESYIVAV